MYNRTVKHSVISDGAVLDVQQNCETLAQCDL